MKKSGLVAEFKEFIARGNMVEMAVGIIIGAAFTSIVNALIDYIINPFITLITGGNGTEIGGLKIPVGGDQFIDFGAFISAIINFLIIALVVFFMVKAFNKMKNGGKSLKKKASNGKEVMEVSPKCPYCLEEVNVDATRCNHCAAELPEPAKMEIVEID